MKLKRIPINSFQSKLIIIISSAFVLAILVGTLYAAFAFRKSTLKSSLETLHIIADNHAGLISSEINHNFEITELTASSLSNLLKESPERQSRELLLLLQSGRLPDDLLLLEFAAKKQSSPQETDQIHERIFIFKGSKGFTVEKFSNRIDQSMPAPTVNRIATKTVFQSPKMLRLSGNKYFTYAVTAPLSDKNIYQGYIRLFFSMKGISELIQRPPKFSAYTKFALVSETEQFLAVTDKPYLTGKDVRLSATPEASIYRAVKNGSETETVKDKLIGFSKVRNEHTTKQWVLLAYIPNRTITSHMLNEIQLSVLLAAIVLIFSLIFTITTVRHFFRDFNRFTNQAKDFIKGDNKPFNEQTPHKEINQLSLFANAVIERRQEIAQTAEAIFNDNYLANIKPLSKSDNTAFSINRINEKLQQIEQAAQKQEAENEVRSWQRKGQLEIAEVQRTGNNDTEELSHNLIRTLVKYTGALLGAIYVTRSESDGTLFAELTGSYAFEEKRSVNIRFEFGEGIVGTCAIERKKIYLENLPDNYIRIGSGMGSSKPGFLALFPIFTQDNLVAVSEIGFMERPKEYKLNFIEQLGENIGSWISAAENQKRLQKLLKLSQEKTRELSEKEAELDSMLKAINHTVLAIQYSPDGSFISANARYYDVMGYEEADLVSTNVLDLVKDRKEELLAVIERVKTGESVERNVVRYTKDGKPVRMKANYSPYYNSSGNITRIIFFGIEEKEDQKDYTDE